MMVPRRAFEAWVRHLADVFGGVAVYYGAIVMAILGLLMAGAAGDEKRGASPSP